ncbi:MAG: ABC transporter ATP-binding protein [Planctomycetota bacterium]
MAGSREFEHEVSGWKYLGRWFDYLMRHRRLLLAAYVSVFAAIAVEVCLPKVLGFVIDDMLKSGAVAKGRIDLPWAGDTTIRSAFLIVLAFLTVLYFIRSVAGYFRGLCLMIVGERVHLNIRQALYDHLQRLPISYFDSSYTGRIMARITSDADALWHLIHDGTLGVVAPAFTIIAVLVVMFRMDVRLTLYALAVIPVVLFFFQVARKRAGESGRAQREALAQIYSRLQERINGIRLIKIFGREESESASFSTDLMELYRQNMIMMRAFNTLGAVNLLITGAATAMILCVGGIAAARDHIKVGELMQFYIYAGMLYMPLIGITGTSARVFTQAEIALGRIFSLLDKAVAEELRAPGAPCPPLTGAVAFDRMSFAYPNGKQVLRAVSFEVGAGQTVALVGPSGVGKTTLINLLCRFYHPQSGAIRVDGIDIATLEAASFRRQISYVTQENILFAGSVAENLRFADPMATAADIETAARRANAHDFIMQLPNGYDTDIGERGVTLSGGQKQRLNIARALLRKPAFFIFDEPTSALDAESESIILDAFRTVFRGRTCLIIAHRLSTVLNADRILVFNEGRIVQDGTHRELYAAAGLYQDLCRKQFVGCGGSEDKRRDDPPPPKPPGPPPGPRPFRTPGGTV